VKAIAKTDATAVSPPGAARTVGRPIDYRRGLAWFAAFLVAQVALTMVVRAGSLKPSWYVPCMVIGSSMTLLTTWLWMRMFAYFPPNMADAYAICISFPLSQIALSAMTNTWMAPGQWIGVGFIIVGIVLLTERSQPTKGGGQ
jgi:hypothetical protein